MGGAPLRDQQVFVYGQIRSGRTAESKDALISQILAAVAEASDLERNNRFGSTLSIFRRDRWSNLVTCFRNLETSRLGWQRFPKPTGR